MSNEQANQIIKRLDTIIKLMNVSLTPDKPMPVDVPTHNIKEAMKKLIAKRGFRKYGRPMTKPEWLTLSHSIAERVIDELNAQTGIDLHQEYDIVKKDQPKTQAQLLLGKIIPKDLVEKTVEIIVIEMAKS